MIHIQCPKCNKRLAVKESQTGVVGVCPACKCKFRIPAAETDDKDDDRSSPDEDDEKERLPARKQRRDDGDDDDEDRRPVRRRRRDDDDRSPDDDDEERRPSRKRNKKRRRKSASGSSGGLNAAMIALICMGGVGLIIVATSFVWPVVAIIPLGLGWLLSFVGGIWFLSIAFQESAVSGLLCLYVPYYSLFYLATHFQDTKRPFFVQLVGIVLAMGGGCAGGFSLGGPTRPTRYRIEIPSRAGWFV